MENNLLTITHAIQLAVAPVFLLTGIAGLMNVLSSRLARVVDRRRYLLQREDDRADLAAAARDRLSGLASAGLGLTGTGQPASGFMTADPPTISTNSPLPPATNTVAAPDGGISSLTPQEDLAHPSEQAARLRRQQTEDAEEIASLDDRARLMYQSIFFAVFAALMVCLVVTTGFISALTQIDLGRAIAGLFIVSMATLVISLVCFLREVYVAVVAGKMHRRA